MQAATQEKTMPGGPIAAALERALEKKTEPSGHRELSWFAGKIAQGRKGEFAEVVDVTPALAERLLGQNESNRKLRRAIISRYASDMAARRWAMNGETVKVSVDGALNDGQHRMAAVIKSGVTVPMLMVFGLPREARMTVDVGVARTAGDFLGMAGVKNANYAAAISKRLLMYRRGQYYENSKDERFLAPTKVEIHEFFDKHRAAVSSAASVVGGTRLFSKYSVAAVGSAHAILHALDREKAAEFFLRLSEGADLASGNPILVLRAAMMTAFSERNTRTEQRLELILRVWNLWREGKSIRRRPDLRGDYPKLVN